MSTHQSILLRRVRGAALVWSDAGSGNRNDLRIYRPLLRPDEISLGHFATTDTYNCNKQWMVAVVLPEDRHQMLLDDNIGFKADSNTNPFFYEPNESKEIKMSPVEVMEGNKSIDDLQSMPPFARPIDFQEVWNDKGTGCLESVLIYRPIAPEGYEAVGDVCVNRVDLQTYDKTVKEIPYLKDVFCLRCDLVSDGEVGRKLWDDSSCGGLLSGTYSCIPVSFYTIKPSMCISIGGFITSSSQDEEGINTCIKGVGYGTARLSTCIKIKPVVFENQ
eukprot:Ihof_evm2s1072 gene=Ihof_evmTU2s1072